MGNQATYSGVMGGLGRLISALNANAADLAHLAGARLRLAKIATDVEGIAQQQAAFTAEFGLQPFRGRKPRTPKSSTPSEPTAPVPTPAPPAAHLAADANSKQ
jgi:hypothetical protein